VQAVWGYKIIVRKGHGFPTLRDERSQLQRPLKR
jgi:hypothetical protein